MKTKHMKRYLKISLEILTFVDKCLFLIKNGGTVLFFRYATWEVF